jgi:hypothetical protein
MLLARTFLTWADLQAATGTNQMVCSCICISIGVLVWAISIPPPTGEHED